MFQAYITYASFYLGECCAHDEYDCAKTQFKTQSQTLAYSRLNIARKERIKHRTVFLLCVCVLFLLDCICLFSTFPTERKRNERNCAYNGDGQRLRDFRWKNRKIHCYTTVILMMYVLEPNEPMMKKDNNNNTTIATEIRKT